jgi:addiction module HigA family antidote
MTGLPQICPGELLQEEFLEPLGISQYRRAKSIGVPASRISEIIAGQAAITDDTDLRLCRGLRLSPGYWLRAQATFDTEVATVELADIHDTLQPFVGSRVHDQQSGKRIKGRAAHLWSYSACKAQKHQQRTVEPMQVVIHWANDARANAAPVQCCDLVDHQAAG